MTSMLIDPSEVRVGDTLIDYGVVLGKANFNPGEVSIRYRTERGKVKTEGFMKGMPVRVER